MLERQKCIKKKKKKEKENRGGSCLGCKLLTSQAGHRLRSSRRYHVIPLFNSLFSVAHLDTTVDFFSKLTLCLNPHLFFIPSRPLYCIQFKSDAFSTWFVSIILHSAAQSYQDYHVFCQTHIDIVKATSCWTLPKSYTIGLFSRTKLTRTLQWLLFCTKKTKKTDSPTSRDKTKFTWNKMHTL